MRTHKILIADDSSIEAERIAATLAKLPGVSTTVVEDGASAVREAKHTRYDLLLVDYEMPSLNGLQVVRMLRGTRAGGALQCRVVCCLSSTIG